ncbi:hypothetical protein LX32DRAFT_72879 [Colletotrichum zoysiae]|uniref:Uncharacterized protein n=1 Tax=Colletotrichum zoysiae TaxID=1216348 RepID=A0AAD9HQZ4_9PEZI|nr:hypothetical protein LX32DRAFT_72879 [Colletotrichum zoysiae]
MRCSGVRVGIPLISWMTTRPPVADPSKLRKDRHGRLDHHFPPSAHGTRTTLLSIKGQTHGDSTLQAGTADQSCFRHGSHLPRGDFQIWIEPPIALHCISLHCTALHCAALPLPGPVANSSLSVHLGAANRSITSAELQPTTPPSGGRVGR